MPASSPLIGTAGRCLALIVLGLTILTPAHADDDQTSRLKQALRDSISALRDAQDQNADLTAKNTELMAQLADQQHTIDSLKAQASSSAASAGSLANTQAALTAAQAQLAQTNDVVKKWQDAYAKLLTAARQRDTAARDYHVQFATASNQLNQCMTKNSGLEKLATEMLGKVGRCSFGDFLAAHEPITQIYRARLETLTDGYADKLRDDSYPPK